MKNKNKDQQDNPCQAQPAQQPPPINVPMLFQRLGEKDYIIGQLQGRIMALEQRLAQMSKDRKADGKNGKSSTGNSK